MLKETENAVLTRGRVQRRSLTTYHLKFNARFPRLREMLVTLMPTEAGTMPLAAEFVKAIADG